MTSLKTLSDHLGLSLATVSRAMNGYSTVKAETRERVLRAAQELNYRPNSAARRLATGRSGAYGVVMPMDQTLLLDSQFPDFMAGLTEALARNDRDVVLGATMDGQAEATYERLVRSGKVDGFVLVQPLREDPRVAMLERMGTPFVLHGRTGASAGHAFHDIDNQGAFRQAADLLVQLGHRRIALLNGNPDAMFAIHRRQGFLAALEGLPADAAFITETPMTEEEGYRCMTAALQAGVTAAVCSSVLLALGADWAIRDAGRTVGRDISLISHDDGISGLRSGNFPVPLTVTRAPIRAAGQSIAGMLEHLTAGAPPESLQVIEPVELVLRASTRPPP